MKLETENVLESEASAELIRELMADDAPTTATVTAASYAALAAAEGQSISMGYLKT